jgi:hypothetical protein
LENGLKIAGSFLAIFLLVACCTDTAHGQAAESKPIYDNAAGTQYASDPPLTSEAGESSSVLSTPEYNVAGHRIRLLVEEGGCWLTHRAEGKGLKRFKFDLNPPCYFLTWQRSPPQRTGAEGVSDGLPLGNIGDPIAWRYRSAKGVIAVAVIGDLIPDDIRSSSLYKSRQQQGYRCASRKQGILFLGNRAWLSKKSESAGLFCVESGVEEKDFWMLAHE